MYAPGFNVFVLSASAWCICSVDDLFHVLISADSPIYDLILGMPSISARVSPSAGDALASFCLTPHSSDHRFSFFLGTHYRPGTKLAL